MKMTSRKQDDENKNNETRKRKSERLSSILKVSKSPPRTALQDLNLNFKVEEEGSSVKKSRPSRRVSFAETCQIKEFDNSITVFTAWDDNQNQLALDDAESYGNNDIPDSSIMLKSVESIELDPEIEGLHTLLTGIIQTNLETKGYKDAQEVEESINETNIESICMESTICEGNISLEESSSHSMNDDKHDAHNFLKSLMQFSIETNRLNTSDLFIPKRLHNNENQSDTQASSFKNYKDHMYNPVNHTDYQTLINTSVNKYISPGLINNQNCCPDPVDTVNSSTSNKLSQNVNLHKKLETSTMCTVPEIPLQVSWNNCFSAENAQSKLLSDNNSQNEHEIIRDKLYTSQDFLNLHQDLYEDESSLNLIEKIDPSHFLAKLVSNSCENTDPEEIQKDDKTIIFENGQTMQGFDMDITSCIGDLNIQEHLLGEKTCIFDNTSRGIAMEITSCLNKELLLQNQSMIFTDGTEMEITNCVDGLPSFKVDSDSNRINLENKLDLNMRTSEIEMRVYKNQPSMSSEAAAENHASSACSVFHNQKSINCFPDIENKNIFDGRTKNSPSNELVAETIRNANAESELLFLDKALAEDNNLEKVAYFQEENITRPDMEMTQCFGEISVKNDKLRAVDEKENICRVSLSVNSLLSSHHNPPERTRIFHYADSQADMDIDLEESKLSNLQFNKSDIFENRDNVDMEITNCENTKGLTLLSKEILINSESSQEIMDKSCNISNQLKCNVFSVKEESTKCTINNEINEIADIDKILSENVQEFALVDKANSQIVSCDELFNLNKFILETSQSNSFLSLKDMDDNVCTEAKNPPENVSIKGVSDSSLPSKLLNVSFLSLGQDVIKLNHGDYLSKDFLDTTSQMTSVFSDDSDANTKVNCDLVTPITLRTNDDAKSLEINNIQRNENVMEVICNSISPQKQLKRSLHCREGMDKQFDKIALKTDLFEEAVLCKETVVSDSSVNLNKIEMLKTIIDDETVSKKMCTNWLGIADNEKSLFSCPESDKIKVSDKTINESDLNSKQMLQTMEPKNDIDSDVNCNTPIINKDINKIPVSDVNSVCFKIAAINNSPDIKVNSPTDNFYKTLASASSRKAEIKQIQEMETDFDDQFLNICHPALAKSIVDKPPNEIRTVEDLLLHLALKNGIHKKNRISIIPINSNLAPKSLKEYLVISHRVVPQLVVYESALKQLQEFIERLDSKINQKEKDVYKEMPHIFLTAAQSFKSEKSKIAVGFSHCKMMATKKCKEWKGKSILRIKEGLIDEKKSLDESCEELDAASNLLDNTSSFMKKCKKWFDKTVVDQEDCNSITEKKIAVIQELNAEIDKKMKDLEQFKKMEQELLKEKLVLTKHQKKERDKLKAFENKEPTSELQDKASNLAALHNHFSKLERLESYNEWYTQEWNDAGAKFFFLCDTILLHLHFAKSSTNITKNISDIQLTSRFEVTPSPLSCFVHNIVFNSVSINKLIEEHKTTETLPVLLNTVGEAVSRARGLMSDLEKISALFPTHGEANCICVEFSNLKAFVKFRIMFEIQSSTYPFASIICHFKSLIGNLRQQELEMVLKSINPGWGYLKRLVTAVDCHIKMESMKFSSPRPSLKMPK